MTDHDWRQAKYNDVYARTLTGLEARRERDPSFCADDVKGTLTHLYVRQGNDQDGRGEPAAIELEAIIDAHEFFLESWRNEVHTG